ncbi:MAG: PD-(D/E)XK nuclease family protein [Lachnospiraceae bacterium]
MALQLWMGNSGSGKSYQLYQHVIKEAGKHPELTYLVVVPEQFTLQTQHDLVMLHPRHGILNIDVLSFARLAYRVFEEVGFANASGILIDDMGKSLILRHLAGQYEDRLPILGNNLKKLGYINEIKSVISEFMQYGIGDREITLLEEKTSASGKTMLNRKLKDIRMLYDAFRSYTDEKYTTSEELLERVSSVLPDSAKIKKSVLVFDGFTGFTPVQYKLLAALLQNSVDVYVTVLLDTAGKGNPYEIEGEQELFYLSKKTVRELTRIVGTLKIEKKPDYVIDDPVPARYRFANKTGSVNTGMLVHLERSLFRPDALPFDSDKVTDEIIIFTGATPEEEMKRTAIKIQELIRRKDYRYQDIAVVTGDIDTYLHCAERIFKQYEIPYFVDKTQPILLNPFIEYLRAVVSVLADDYSYEGMFRYLKSSLTDFDREEIDRLENYVLACGIKGRRQWKQRFVRRTAAMETEELRALEEFRNKITSDFEIFDTADKTVRSLADAFYRFIFRGRMQDKLTAYETRLKDSGELARAKEFAQVYKQVMDLLDKLVELLGGEEMTIREFGGLLDAGFDEIRIGVIPGGTDYVQLGDITRTRLRKIKALFFVGVNDGIIPMSSGAGGIISDMDREFLMDLAEGITLAPSARMQAYTQRLYLYMVMTKPEEKLFLSYAKLSEDGKSIRPSYLIQTVCTMFPALSILQTEGGLLSRIWNENAGFMELTEGLQPYIIRGKSAQDKAYGELFEWYAGDPDYKKQLQKLIDSAFSMGVYRRRDAIGRAAAGVLYGKELTGSVTRLESYARCAYQHFLTYGLSLKERELFSFEAKDMGMVFHDALQTYAGLLKESGDTWFSVSAEKSAQLIDEAVSRCIAAGDYAAVYSSFRTTYMVERMKRITARTVGVLTSQIKKGSFLPESFELAFSSENDYRSLNMKLSENEILHLRGRIDRMDLYEDDTRVYVKIIDYKSGSQSFDLSAVYSGLQLQLVVYLNAAMEMQERRQEKEGQKTVIPAGILYYHIDDPIIESGRDNTPEEINRQIASKLAMKGLVNSGGEIIRLMDREFEKTSDVIPVSLLKSGELSARSSVASTEEFQTISDYVTWKMGEMGTEIINGNIQAKPQNDACVYCQYRTVCHYAAEIEDREETEQIGQLTKEELIAKMKASMEREGSGQ